MSPTLTSGDWREPSSFRLPGPTWATSPIWGFSLAVSNVLKHLGVKFTGINVLEDNNLREGIKTFSDWPTIPQLYIKKEFIGGCDIVKEMFEKKELQSKLSEKNISYNS